MRIPLALPWLLLLAALAACEGNPGTSSSAFGESEFTSATQSFSLRYLSPPWSVVESSAQSLELEIPAQVFGLALEGSPPTHVFKISHVEEPDGIDGILDDNTTSSETESGSGGVDPGDVASSSGEGGEPVVDPEHDLGPPDYLLRVDLGSPHAVALAELNHLVQTRGAQLDSATAAFSIPGGTSGVVWQVQIEPGIYVRSFYFASDPTVVRAAFGSLFNIDTQDVDAMVGSFRFGAAGTP